jgi:hypothetical protein
MEMEKWSHVSGQVCPRTTEMTNLKTEWDKEVSDTAGKGQR